MYFVINSLFDVCDFSFSELAWKKFESSMCTKNSIFRATIVTSMELIHGLEYKNISGQWAHIVRKNADIMLVDSCWKNALILTTCESSNLLSFLCQLFYTHAVQQHILYLHSSLINYRDHGLMFLGPSGIGKTTQAELWNRYRDALIINGDVVFVQETENTFLGWGTPWHGSSPYCENTNVPVHAMIVLTQSPENSIRELTGFEKVTAVSQSVFYPRWLEKGMELCLETLDHLLTKVPVYELSCRPDEEAVRLTEEAVFGKAVI